MKRSEKQKNFGMIGIRRQSIFSGKRRVGLDTNVFIKLYDQPMLFEYEESRIFRFGDLIFTNKICVFELARYIKKKNNIDMEEARKEAKEFIRKHNINVIYDFIPEDEVNKFEKESNEKLKRMRKTYLECHKPDSIIVLSFKKRGINKVISTDEAFRICATFLGMDGASLPSLDAIISRELRKVFDYRKKKWSKGRRKR
ncbi:MAG: PIN domain-containing protein [Nanoarchaeota archaeon]|nr:PIN domain-containing protein [Nanoarchaeota archaeon]